MLVHVVLFRLAQPDRASDLADQMRAMQGRVPTLRELEVGVECLPSERSAHIALIARFDDEQGLRDYARHPVHQEVLAAAQAAGARTTKVDYSSSSARRPE